MEGHNNNFTFMSDDLGGYDDLIQNTAWPSDADHQQQQFFAPPSQDPYARYTASQQTAAHGHYNSQQPSYPPVSYSNSPYASQYQHARPSDVFGPTTYNVDPSLQGTTYQGHESSFSYTPQRTDNATIAPQSLQYGLSQNTAMNNRSVSNPAFQRTANGMENNIHLRPQDQSNMYFQNATSQNGSVLSNQANNVRYPMLANEDSDSKPYIKRQDVVDNNQMTPVPRPQQVRPVSPPNPLRSTRPDLLDGSDTSSKARLPHAQYLRFEDTPVQVTLGLKSKLTNDFALVGLQWRTITDTSRNRHATEIPPQKVSER